MIESLMIRGSFEPLVAARRVLAALSALTLLLGLAWPFLGQRRPAIRTGNSPASSSAATSSSAVLADDLREIIKKDLFASGAAVPLPRPAPRAVQAAPPAPPKPTLAQKAADLELVGILNDGKQAVIANKKSKETLYVKTGDRIGDIAVTAVRSGGVTLAYDGESMELSL